MIDRIARRLFLLAPARYLNGGPRRYHVDWDLLRRADRENYREAAKRLIDEMRVPTDPMVRAGARDDASPVTIWQAMVGAALLDDGS